ncbi:oligosaccharide flippase family protein [Mycoplasmatota bacterium]|nr:oligosaccharide flippase family protein [Mycoplasmatota bacterium]
MFRKIKVLLETSLFKTATIFTGANIISKSIPFLLLPILTRYLTPADYGIVSMFALVVSVLVSLVGVNTHGAIARNYYDKNKKELKIYISSTFVILIYSVLLISLLFIIIGKLIATLVSLPLIMLWIALAIAIAQYIQSVTLVLWQVQKKAFSYGVYNISKSFINVILSIIFVVVLSFSWQGRIYAQLITALLFIIVSIIVLKKNKWIGMEIDKCDLKDALKFGLPLIPHIIGAILITMIDRFFITYYSGVA